MRASLSSDYNLEKNRGHPDREFDIFLEEPFDPEGMTIKIGDAEERNLNITWNHELLRISKHKDLKRLYWRLKLHRSPSVRKWLEHFSPAGLIKGLFRFKFRRKVIYSMASVEDNQCPGIEFKWHRLGVPDLTNPELELRFGEVLKEFNSTRLTVVRAILNRRPGQGGQARVRASGPNRASMAALQEFDPTSGTVTAIELESNGHGHP
ncbi:MAG TPA: hypothetical protein VLU25_03350 [Acidobacteriota bacterium]|nr:hypothetical protein [Acidobacteriota bacterium]